MTINTYHVYNVLRAYGKQLRQRRRLPCKKGVGEANRADRFDISARTRQKAVFDKVASHIIDKLTEKGPHECMEKKAFRQLEDERGNRPSVKKEDSESSREVQRAKEVIMSEPNIRSEKVRAIQEEVERGTYEIDYDKIAENMLGFFMFFSDPRS